MFHNCRLALLLLLAGSGALSLVQARHGGPIPAVVPVRPRSTEEQIWRTADHDGTNCLYILLRLSGRQVAYTEVRQALVVQECGNTFLGLREAARRLGLGAVIYKGGPDELVREHLPAIIHVEGPNKNAGYFALLFAVNERECHLINGASATIERIRTDDFRRNWSGYGLRPAPAGNGWAIFLGSSLLALAGYGGWRLWSARAANDDHRLPSEFPTRSSNL